MSMTGPGCPACDYRGRVHFFHDPSEPEHPCGSCSPWSHLPGFPEAALRLRAKNIHEGREEATEAMREWAERLIESAHHVDASWSNAGTR